jgi:hypothetical protein
MRLPSNRPHSYAQVDAAPNALNRAARRKQQAIGRKQRKLFTQYKAHMAKAGYDATFDDFIKDMP